ncbi:MAG: hypothetical protein E7319_03185 [Clostridiales bacterium]|nr:hypothetical protein [Clostridiales bacterium]
MISLPFTLLGTVVRGKQLGTQLGFPTANIRYDAQLAQWPREGVYVGLAQPEDEPQEYLCILNQGKHPTTPEGIPTVEAHLLAYSGQALYDRKLRLTYLHFLRPEQTFDTLDDLKAQLADDRQAALLWASQHNVRS